MQFMLLCCFDESRWSALPEGERATIMQAYEQWIQAQAANGTYLAGGKLDESSRACTVRGGNGKVAAVDGPFAETKEQIGGYHIIECADRDAAIAIAGGIPTLPAGGRIEVRPLLRAYQYRTP